MEYAGSMRGVDQTLFFRCIMLIISSCWMSLRVELLCLLEIIQAVENSVSSFISLYSISPYNGHLARHMGKVTVAANLFIRTATSVLAPTTHITAVRGVPSCIILLNKRSKLKAMPACIVQYRTTSLFCLICENLLKTEWKNPIELVRGAFQWWTHLFRIDAGLWPQVETSVRLGLQSTATLACCLDIESGDRRGDDLSSAAFDWLCAPAALHCRYLKLIECNIREMGQRDDKWAALWDYLEAIVDIIPVALLQPAWLDGSDGWFLSSEIAAATAHYLMYNNMNRFFPRRCFLNFFCQQLLALVIVKILKSRALFCQHRWRLF